MTRVFPRFAFVSGEMALTVSTTTTAADAAFAFGEPEMPAVHAEDRVIVRNVLYAGKVALEENARLDNWSVQVADKHYVVDMYLPPDGDCVISLRDMQAIADVSPLRVTSVSVRRVAGATFSLRVLVSNRDQPVVLTETEVVRIRKRKKLFGLF